MNFSETSSLLSFRHFFLFV